MSNEQYPEWKQAIIDWAKSIDTTPTDDPSKIMDRLNLSMTYGNWEDACKALGTTDEVAQKALSRLERNEF